MLYEFGKITFILCFVRSRKVSSSKSLNFSILPKNPHHYDYIVNFDFFTEIFLKVRLFLQKIYILSRLKKLRMQHFFFVFFLNLQQHCASASIKRKNRCSKNHKTSISSFKNLKKGIKKSGHFLSDQSLFLKTAARTMIS